ncbi:unnamed protein product [Paramecium sonneborni]|uniref:Uncharacterized protein n=1 Tax=Paramecium sonneborni TaxID=65129 RepID=A0A8S1PLR9_9CILI|nr:unnamed protein product [Paramecium sonneborni]
MQSQQQFQSKQLELNEIIENNPGLDEKTDQIYFQYMDALNGLKKIKIQDVYEMKSIRRPPQLIERVLNLLTILLKENYVDQDNWIECLKLLNDRRFLDYLLNYDISSITEEKLNLLQPIHTFDEKIIYSSSFFVYQIYKYILAIVKQREQPKQKVINQIGQMKQDLRKLQKYIEKLKKILGQTE